jgi:hypothetical protein
MSMRCLGLIPLSGAAVLAAVAAAGCGSTGEPSGGGLWRAHEVRLQADYDTTPPVGGIGLDVELDTLRNARGQPVVWARVSATNRSDRDLVGTTGLYFHWRFTAYDDAARAGEPLWSNEQRVGVYPDAGLFIRLPAGATQVFPATGLDIGETIATRGPGTYYFAARLWGWLSDPPGGWLTERIPAGAVVILP